MKNAQERFKKIETLIKSISEAKEPDFKELEMFACAEWGITLRTAKELIKIAKWKLNMTNGKKK